MRYIGLGVHYIVGIVNVALSYLIAIVLWNNHRWANKRIT